MSYRQTHDELRKALGTPLTGAAWLATLTISGVGLYLGFTYSGDAAFMFFLSAMVLTPVLLTAGFCAVRQCRFLRQRRRLRAQPKYADSFYEEFERQLAILEMRPDPLLAQAKVAEDELKSKRFLSGD